MGNENGKAIKYLETKQKDQAHEIKYLEDKKKRQAEEIKKLKSKQQNQANDIKKLKDEQQNKAGEIKKLKGELQDNAIESAILKGNQQTFENILSQVYNKSGLHEKKIVRIENELGLPPIETEESQQETPSRTTPSTESNNSNSVREECIICVNNPPTILFSPCGHYNCCAGCAGKVTTCPTCREPINNRQRVYF